MLVLHSALLVSQFTGEVLRGVVLKLGDHALLPKYLPPNSDLHQDSIIFISNMDYRHTKDQEPVEIFMEP